MPLDVHIEADHIHALLTGEWNIQQAADLKDDLFGLLNFRHISLDLSGILEMDTCGLQMLMLLKAEADRLQKPLQVAACNVLVHEQCELLGLRWLAAAPQPCGADHAIG